MPHLRLQHLLLLKGIDHKIIPAVENASGKILISWSGGKDAALALHYVQSQNNGSEIKLFTNVNEDSQTIAMHGVPVALLRQQAAALGLPITALSMPEMPSTAFYENKIAIEMEKFKSAGFHTIVFGDIFLEDLRKYREQQMAALGLKALFPLWQLSTHKLIQHFTALGFKAIVCCVNDAYLSKDYVGKIIDADFVRSLPAHVDPCGENGEFHSFVFDGPNFSAPVQFNIGNKFYKKFLPAIPSTVQPNDSNNVDPFANGFWYCNLEEKG